MKTTTSMSFRQLTLRCALLLTFGLIGTAFLQAQTVQQYADTEVDQLMTDMNADAYDVYELTTPGGSYVLTSTGLSPIRSSKDFMLMAADGLAEKPILSFSAATSSGTRYMFYPAATITASFEGLAIDGFNPLGIVKSPNETGQPNFIRTFTTSINTNIIIRDCYFYDFEHYVGAFRIDGAGTSLDIQGSTFKNCSSNIVNFQTAGLAYGDLLLKNNTFSDITDYAPSGKSSSVVVYANTSSGTNVSIDHCTFNNLGGTKDLFVFKSIIGDINIKNSLFNNVNGGFDFAAPVPTIDYCYLDGFATAPTGTITNSFTGTSPAFTDVAALNYGLTNKSEFICADNLPVGNTMYYPEITVGEMTVDASKMIRIEGKTIYTSEPGTIKIYNLQGIKVAGDVAVSVMQAELNHGIYILQFTNKAGKRISQKIYIN